MRYGCGNKRFYSCFPFAVRIQHKRLASTVPADREEKMRRRVNCLCTCNESITRVRWRILAGRIRRDRPRSALCAMKFVRAVVLFEKSFMGRRCRVRSPSPGAARSAVLFDQFSLKVVDVANSTRSLRWCWVRLQKKCRLFKAAHRLRIFFVQGHLLRSLDLPHWVPRLRKSFGGPSQRSLSKPEGRRRAAFAGTNGERVDHRDLI